MFHRFTCSVKVAVSHELAMKEKDASKVLLLEELTALGARGTEVLKIPGTH